MWGSRRAETAVIRWTLNRKRWEGEGGRWKRKLAEECGEEGASAAALTPETRRPACCVRLVVRLWEAAQETEEDKMSPDGKAFRRDLQLSEVTTITPSSVLQQLEHNILTPKAWKRPALLLQTIKTRKRSQFYTQWTLLPQPREFQTLPDEFISDGRAWSRLTEEEEAKRGTWWVDVRAGRTLQK